VFAINTNFFRNNDPV